MSSFTISKSLHAAPERVFEALTDFANAPGRIQAIKRLEVLTPGPVRAGTRFRETRIMFKREDTQEMEVVEFDPPRRVVIGGDACGCRFRTEFVVSAAAQPAGAAPRTEVRMTMTSTALTFFAKVMSVLMRPMLGMMVKHCAKDLDDLAAFFNAESAGKPGSGDGSSSPSLRYPTAS